MKKVIGEGDLVFQHCPYEPGIRCKDCEHFTAYDGQIDTGECCKIKVLPCIGFSERGDPASLVDADFCCGKWEKRKGPFSVVPLEYFDGSYYGVQYKDKPFRFVHQFPEAELMKADRMARFLNSLWQEK